MLFHRNPWKDPAPGDPNFDNYLREPISFLLSKFTGISRDVATYLADHVICNDVDARVPAREFGRWIGGLPDMIGGRKAVNQLKMARLNQAHLDHETSLEKGLFVKAPIGWTHGREKNQSPSALTSSAPFSPTSSHLPPPLSQLTLHASALTTPDLERDDIGSATTVEEQPTPLDANYSIQAVDGDITVKADAESRSLSLHKRRKRGVRKGKAALAALAAAAAGEDNKPSQEDRDSLLVELAEASQSLARDLSKNRNHPDFDVTRAEDFPPLGTTPAHAAVVKKAKWKDLMKLSSGNPEIAALARRVAERDASSIGNWSAPAKLQQDGNPVGISKPSFKHTATTSSGISSALSSFGPVSSATSSSGGVDDDDWRRPRAADEAVRGREKVHAQTGRLHDGSTSRMRNAAVAAVASTGTTEPMGSFGKGLLQSRFPALPAIPAASASYLAPAPVSIESHGTAPSTTPASQPVVVNPMHQPPSKLLDSPVLVQQVQKSHFYHSSSATGPSLPTSISSSTITTSALSPTPTSAPSQSPNKPKLKGQIQSLAKMLSGLKTKGRD